MGASSSPPSDDELHAFVDGEVASERRLAIENFLKTSPLHAERVDEWQRQGQMIRAAFAPADAEPAQKSALLAGSPREHAFLRPLNSCGKTPAEAGSSAPATRQDSSLLARITRKGAMPLSFLAPFLAGAIAALAGIYLTDYLHTPPAADRPAQGSSAAVADSVLASRAIAAAADFKPLVHANAPGSAGEKSLHGTIEGSLVVPNLSGAGFTLVGMRAAAAPDGGPAGDMLCLFYAKGGDPSVTLCIARNGPDTGPPRFHFATQPVSNASGGAVSWRQANATYILAASLDEAGLGALAGRVSAAIDAFD